MLIVTMLTIPVAMTLIIQKGVVLLHPSVIVMILVVDVNVPIVSIVKKNVLSNVPEKRIEI